MPNSRDGWFTNASARTVLSVQQFLTKNGMTPVPHPLYSPDLTKWLFLYPWMKKVLKGKCFANVEEVKKNWRSTTRHPNGQVQKLFWAVEKTSWKVYCIKWRVLWRWVKLKHVRIQTKFLINSGVFLGAPPHMIPIIWNIQNRKIQRQKVEY